MTARQESEQILHEVVEGLSAGATSLKHGMLKCQHACQFMQWADWYRWFDLQFTGYPESEPVEHYRSIHGRVQWVPEGHTRGNTAVEEYIAKRSPGAIAFSSRQGKPCSMPTRAGVDWLLEAAKVSYAHSTGRTEDFRAAGNRIFTWEERFVFSTGVFMAVLTQIEHLVFNFASSRYALLAFGDELTNIWEEHLQLVESALSEAGLTARLNAIRLGFQSENLEAKRDAVFGCRTLLEDLAAYLWQDPRSTYDFLDAADGKGKLAVTKHHYLNRFRAYLHQKRITGNKGKHYGAELDRLEASLVALKDAQSAAHAQMPEADMRLVLLSTYFLIGAFATKTDMQPVTHYDEISPAKQAEDAI